MKKWLHIFCFLAVLNVTAQEGVFASWAESALADKDYFGAKKYYLKALEYDSTNAEYLLGAGKAYQQLYALDSAVYYYNKLKQTEAYKEYPEVDFYLAKTQKMRGHYNEAHELFSFFSRNYRGKNRYLADFAKNEISQKEFINSILSDSVEVILTDFPAPINSSVADFAGTLLNDSTLMFSSLEGDSIMQNNRKPSSIYQSISKGSVWESKEVLRFKNATSNADYANLFFDKKDSSIYFSVCSMDQGCEIYEGKKEGGKWIASPLPETINDQDGNTTQPMVYYSNGKKYLLFSSNRTGGKGNQDLWMSSFDKEWKTPKNLGNKVNTKGNELTPYVFQDTLYFASDWHPNVGGFDVFKISWSNSSKDTPVNLGVPLNSVGNDLYFAPLDSVQGVFTSNRAGIYSNATICCNDLFHYTEKSAQEEKAPEEVVKYQLIALLDHIPVKLYFHNDRPMPDSWDTISIYNYIETYAKYIQRKPEYRKEFAKLFPKEKKDSAYAIVDSFFINHVEKGLTDLEFFSDTIINILNKGFSVRIAVKGFASPLAKNDYNINLSKRRINSFKKCLINYPKGNYAQYLADTAKNGARLEIVRVPNGEELSNPYVSDDYYDTRKSIFHPAAAFERRVEVLDLVLIDDENKMPIVAFKGEKEFTINLGMIDSLYSEHEIILQNQLLDSLSITNAEATCGCTNIGEFNGEIAPLYRSKMKFSIKKELPGKYMSEIILKDKTGHTYSIKVYFEIPETEKL